MSFRLIVFFYVHGSLAPEVWGHVESYLELRTPRVTLVLISVPLLSIICKVVQPAYFRSPRHIPLCIPNCIPGEMRNLIGRVHWIPKRRLMSYAIYAILVFSDKAKLS